MRYLIELRAPRRSQAVDGHVVDEDVINVADGVHAEARALADLTKAACLGADHADVWQADGTGDRTYYTTVRSGDRVYVTAERAVA